MYMYVEHFNMLNESNRRQTRRIPVQTQLLPQQWQGFPASNTNYYPQGMQNSREQPVYVSSKPLNVTSIQDPQHPHYYPNSNPNANPNNPKQHPHKAPNPPKAIYRMSLKNYFIKLKALMHIIKFIIN